jgi:hypothetical protein
LGKEFERVENGDPVFEIFAASAGFEDGGGARRCGVGYDFVERLAAAVDATSIRIVSG